MSDEIDEICYILTDWNNSIAETTDRREAQLALREGREVVKSVRKVFYSGPSLIRLYVTTPIKKSKDL